MTKINKLLMRGFKSFAFKTELLLGNNFNVILGPNGSGKSNVIDALCFVLGKSSTKSLRAEKSANLIYNGGKTNKPAKEGEVSIWFDNSKKTFPSDEKEIKITRLVKETGQSVYKINDKVRTRQQIIDLLSLAKINPDGYNLILQGDIVRFVEMPTEDRRQIVEQIAGISSYEEKRGKALRELEKVDIKIKESEIILTERKTHLDGLKSERDQAKKYKEIKDNIQTSKASYLKIGMDNKQIQLDGFDKAIKDYKSKIAKTEQEVKELQAKIQSKKDEIKKISNEIEEKGEKEQVRVHKEVEKLNIDLATNRSRISSCENEIIRISSREDQLRRNQAEISQKISDLEAEKLKMEDDKSKAQQSLNQFENKIRQFKQKNKLEDAPDIEAEIEKIDAEIEQEQKKVQESREKQQELLREKDRIEMQSKSLDDTINKVAVVAQENKEQVEELKKKKQEFKNTTVTLNITLNEDSSLAAQIGNARGKLIKATEELSKIEARNIGMREGTFGDISITKINEQKNKIRGIYGSVTELGTVPSKYGLALEVAAGPRLKSIVVEDDKVASQCISFLKQNRYGVATFLPLNKIRETEIKSEAASLKNANGVIGLAIDLISFDPKYKKVFSYVFGSTLVVDSLNTARRIGVGNVRMVTIEGDLCELSGAMQGGFRQQKKQYGFQEKEAKSNILEYEKEVETQRSIIDVLEKRKEENEDKIEQLRIKKAELEGEIIKSERSLHLEEGDLEATRTQRKSLKEGLLKIDKELKLISDAVVELNKVLAQKRMKKEDLRTKIKQLKSPTLLAELNTFEQKKSELKEELTKYLGETKNIETQIKTILMPEKENIQKILTQHDKEAAKFKDEIETLKEKIKRQTAELKSKEEEEKKFYAQFKDMFNKRNKANEDMQKLETTVIKKEEETRRTEQKSNMVSLDFARVNAEMAGLKEEYKQYEGVRTIKKPEEELKKEIWEFERMVEQIGSVNLKALDIYEAVENEYESLMKKKETLGLEKQDVLVMMNEIESKKKELFLRTFVNVNEHFQKFFNGLSTKGEASLELENPDSPFEAGINIKVRLTGKKFMDIKSLSGGEKTLTALAFIFAIQEFEPASFYVLDEVDAALDKRNSEKLSRFIQKYAEKSQYILISHNEGIICSADTLYGVSMNEHGMSKVVSLKV